MKRIVTSILVVCVLSIGLAGCSDKTKTKKQTETSGPGGKTTTTQTTETQKSGDNPPAAAPK